MPKQSRRRLLTWNRRREPMHNVQSQCRRVHRLNSIDLSYTDVLQLQIGESLTAGHAFNAGILEWMSMSYVTHDPVIRCQCNDQIRIFDLTNRMLVHPMLFEDCHNDYLLCDVPDHLDLPYQYKQPAMRTFNDWSEDDCLKISPASQKFCCGPVGPTQDSTTNLLSQKYSQKSQMGNIGVLLERNVKRSANGCFRKS